jgi:ubiquinone/menaquinone biosynthesis C-methylase UbiE
LPRNQATPSATREILLKIDYSFDRRIARQYEQQRAHPPEVAAAVGQALLQAVGPTGHLLEMGIGTGRIARPAAAAGCRVTGFDLSWEMLQEIAQPTDAPDPHVLTLCQADMHHLPFADNSFDAVVTVHVLHLARDIHQVLREATRVLKPGGVFIRGDDWLAPDSVVNQFRNQLRGFVLRARPDMKPPGAGADLDALLGELGGGPATTHTVAEWTTHAVPAEVLATIANRTHSESWVLPDEMLAPAVDEISAWANATWPDLQAAQPVYHRFNIRTMVGEW